MKRNFKEEDIINLAEKNFSFPEDPRVIIGPGDDCAQIRTGASSLIVTTDEAVEGTHYLERFADPAGLACKLMRMNLSDLAGMGAVRPVSCVIGAGLRADTPLDFLETMFSQLRKEADYFGLSIAGGNTTAARENHFYITVWGEPAGNIIKRSGTEAGDLLCSVGPLGEARAGLDILDSGDRFEKAGYPELIDSFWRPAPRFGEGKTIADNGLAHAMLDNSDGLLRSAKILAEMSGVRAVLEPGAECCSKPLGKYCDAHKKDWREYVISGGEDYGLVFSASPDKENDLRRLLPGVSIVGRFEPGAGVEVKNYSGAYGSFEHF